MDEIDAVRLPRPLGSGATEYVLRHGKPLLADRQIFDQLAAEGECVQTGAPSVCWLGVPLVWDDRVMGVLAVQSYSPKHIYDARDQELLTFVSYHIANALQRKQTSESLKLAYVNLERRVTERTRALALANRDLREQIAERERVERRLEIRNLARFIDRTTQSHLACCSAWVRRLTGFPRPIHRQVVRRAVYRSRSLQGD